MVVSGFTITERCLSKSGDDGLPSLISAELGRMGLKQKRRVMDADSSAVFILGEGVKPKTGRKAGPEIAAMPCGMQHRLM